MSKPRLHLVGIFHTLATSDYSHCAFTGKAMRFPRMMMAQGHEVIEYSNWGSKAGATEHVEMLSKCEFEEFYGGRGHTSFHGDDATIGSDGHRLFEARLIPAIRKNLGPQDIICHPFGHAHQILMSEFPNHQHVETGIGYPTLMPNSYRIFESYAWMHYHQGKENRNGRNYEWVVPNYYDLNDWEVSETPGEYLAFLGRITSLKGLDTIRAIAEHSPYPIVLHGQGDPTPWSHPNIIYKGPITGKERSKFLSGARALLAPSLFTEPFCGMSVEAMLCGTPVISVDYGAMTETVREGMGFRCHTLQDWVEAVDKVGDLDRAEIARIARSKYSLEACGAMYDKIFGQLNDLYRRGWYEMKEISYVQIEYEEKPFAKRLAGWIDENLQPSCCLDIGCGPGIYVDELRELGIDSTGIDTDDRVSGKPYLKQQSLFDLTDEQADVVICLEVAEHIGSENNRQIAKKAAGAVKAGGTLIWSAAQPGQGGSGHINCQPKEYWKDELTQAGLQFDPELTDSVVNYARSGYHMGWFANNAMVFQNSLKAE